MDFELAGVSFVAIVLGIVEAAKEFGVKGRWSLALAMIVGLLLFGLGGAIEGALVPADCMPWIEATVKAIAGSLAVAGFYRLSKRVGGAVLDILSLRR